MKKISQLIFYGLLGLTIATTVGAYGAVVSAQTPEEGEEITKEEFLDFQGQWFDYMDRRGVNPGRMMGGEEMDRDEFMSFHEEMFDLMEKYGIDPALKMKEGMCAGMMMRQPMQ